MKHLLRSLSIFILLLGAVLNSTAQHSRTFSFDEPYETQTRSRYKTMRVIDVRPDKKTIGYVKKGALDTKIWLIPEKPLDRLLPEQFDKILGQTTTKNAEGELVFVIHNILVEDLGGSPGIGSFFLDGDFYSGINGHFTYLGTVDTLCEVRAGFDVTNKLIRGVQASFNYILSHYATMTSADNHVYTEQQLASRRKEEKQQYRIYTDAPDFKKGVYYTVDQFLNNTPVDTDVVVKEYRPVNSPTYMSVYLPKPNGKKGKILQGEDFFAAYDGTTWACGLATNYVKMDYIDGDFYTVKRFRGATANTGGVIAGAAMFGLVGALAVGAATSGNDSKGWVYYYSKFNPEKKTFTPVRRGIR